MEQDVKQYEYKAPAFSLKNRQKNLPDELRPARHVQQSSLSSKKEEISVLLAGDLLCQEGLIASCKTANGYDFRPCFQYVKPLFKAADLVIGNLETPISPSSPYRGELLSHEGPFYCNAPVEYPAALKEAGFDLLTTANNHTLDAGVRGLLETLDNIATMGFLQTGTFAGPTEKYLLVNCCGFKIGVVAFGTKYNTMEENLTEAGRETLLNTYSKERARTLWEQMKQAGAEYTICFPHSGIENTENISGLQDRIAGELSDIGYDFILNSHSHTVQAMTEKNGTPVVFCLGNLMSHLRTITYEDTKYTALCRLVLKKEEEGIKADISFIPCQLMPLWGKDGISVIPCNETLQTLYDESILKKLEGTAQKVQSALKTDARHMELNAPVLLEQFEDFKKTVSFLPEEETQVPFDSVTLQNGAAFAKERKESEYQKTHIGWYRAYKDGLALEQITSGATVIRIPKKTAGTPVFKVGNKYKGNDTARIIYINRGIREIAPAAFQNYTKLESVRLFPGLKEQGGQAVYDKPVRDAVPERSRISGHHFRTEGDGKMFNEDSAERNGCNKQNGSSDISQNREGFSLRNGEQRPCFLFCKLFTFITADKEGIKADGTCQCKGVVQVRDTDQQSHQNTDEKHAFYPGKVGKGNAPHYQCEQVPAGVIGFYERDSIS